MIDSIDYKGEDGKDILGDIYIYLIGKFAASAGKKGGEFYTPHEVSKLIAKIVTDGLQESTNLSQSMTLLVALDLYCSLLRMRFLMVISQV